MTTMPLATGPTPSLATTVTGVQPPASAAGEAPSGPGVFAALLAGLAGDPIATPLDAADTGPVDTAADPTDPADPADPDPTDPDPTDPDPTDPDPTAELAGLSPNQQIFPVGVVQALPVAAVTGAVQVTGSRGSAVAGLAPRPADLPAVEEVAQQPSRDPGAAQPALTTLVAGAASVTGSRGSAVAGLAPRPADASGAPPRPTELPVATDAAPVTGSRGSAVAGLAPRPADLPAVEEVAQQPSRDPGAAQPALTIPVAGAAPVTGSRGSAVAGLAPRPAEAAAPRPTQAAPRPADTGGGEPRPTDLPSLVNTAAPAPVSAPASVGGQVSASTPVVSQVVPEVTRLVQAGPGTHRMVLRLDPEHLGEVRITVTVHQGEVRVRLAAATDQARSQLDHGTAELHRALEQVTQRGGAETKVAVTSLNSPAPLPMNHQNSHPSPSTGQPQGDTAQAGTGGFLGGDAQRQTPDGQQAHRDAGRPAGTRVATIARDGTSDAASPPRPADPFTSARTRLDVSM